MFFSEKIASSIARIILVSGEGINKNTELVDFSTGKNLNTTKNVEVVDKDVICDGNKLFSIKDYSFESKEIYRYTFAGGKPEIETIVTVDGERSFVKNAETIKVGDSYAASVSFEIEEDEAIYGLGQHEDGIYNYRNCKEYLYHNNMKIPMPVYLSSKGYAVLFDASCMMTYEEKDNVITVCFDAAEKIDFYVIAGENFDELIAGIRSLTGHNVMLPRWAYGYIQSKERYKTQDEIVETAARFKEEDIPLSCIVLDWLSWEDGKWGNQIFDKSRFPEAKKMVDELHAQGVKFMISVWPNRKEGCENHTEFYKAGKLLCNFSTYDAFDEEARDIYWKQMERELFAAGTDAWWCDSTEPFTPDWNGLEKRPNDMRYQMAIDSTNKYLDARNSSAYCVMHSKGIYEHQRAVNDGRRITNLTRAGYLGTQKYGTILWSGDTAATWETFKNQIAEGLSMGMSGISNWTWDAGAFFVGSVNCWNRAYNHNDKQAPWFYQGDFEEGVKDLGYAELYTRWLQASCFLPIMRSHGTDTPREPWNFGDKGTVYYDTIVKYIKLRYALMPYIYSLAIESVVEDSTMMRSLAFDFLGDEKARLIKDSFMLGKSIYVCPVTEPIEYGPESVKLGKKAVREVYFPAGYNWYDFETGVKYEGGTTVVVDAPIKKIPVFIREGSIIPMSNGTDGKLDKIKVFGGRDAGFTMYTDGGDGYEYEVNGFEEINFSWDDKAEILCAKDKNGAKLQVEVEVVK